jgi:hypothetical protein
MDGVAGGKQLFIENETDYPANLERTHVYNLQLQQPLH